MFSAPKPSPHMQHVIVLVGCQSLNLIQILSPHFPGDYFEAKKREK